MALTNIFILHLLFVLNVGDDFLGCARSARFISDVFCLPSSYRKETPPKTNGPINVFFKLPITEVSNVDDRTREISLRLGYYMRWPEHRMVLNDSADWSRGEINVNPDIIKNFWVPDILIHDLVRFSTPTVIQEVAALEIVRDHSLYYKMRQDNPNNVRSEVRLVCGEMMFSRFPLDSHVCQLRLSSYGYDMSLMKINGRFSYDRASQRDLPFYTEIRELDLSSRVYVGDERNYSMYGVEIILTRAITPALLSLYLPSTILTTLSWLAFLLPHPLVRLTLQLLITIIMLNIINTTRNDMPPANSITAVEIWFLGCLIMMLLSIIELILERSTFRRHPSNTTSRSSCSSCQSAPVSSCRHLLTSNSTTSSRANMLSSTEEIVEPDSEDFLQLVTSSTSFNAKCCQDRRSTGAERDVVLETIQPSDRECLANTLTLLGPASPRDNYKANYKDNKSHLKFIFPLIFCNFAVVYWIYFLHLT